jgi:hypothetical protein
LKETLVNDFRQYRERMKMLKQRADDAKKVFSHWELQKWRQWLKDQDWRRRWREKLEAEREVEAKTGHLIARQHELEEISQLRTVSACRRHLKLLISNLDLRLGREFNAWKQEKENIAKKEQGTDWKPPVVKWREFELRLKYGRYWRRTVKDRKEQFRKKVEAEWSREQECRSRTHSRSTSAVNSDPQAGTVTSNNEGQGSDFVDEIVPKKQSDKVIPKELSKEEAIQYDRKIRENFKQRSGGDGYYFYTMFGECYIHGMMDGEAMAYQNENGIPTTVFELR